MMRFQFAAALLTISGLSALPAAALTMTFDFGAGVLSDTDSDFTDDTYSEDGIAMTGFIFGAFGEDNGRAHLDNPGDGHFTDELVFSTGFQFDLASFDLVPLGFDCSGCAPYDNVIVTGRRNGFTIAQSIFAMGGAPGLFLGAALFLNLDELAISTINGPSPDYDFSNSHFEIDNVSLTRSPSPIPLPAAFGPFAAALIGAGVWLRRRKPGAA